MAAVLEMPASADKAKKPDAGTINWFNQCVERGKSEVFSETTLLTPGLAGELLKRNPDNRNIRKVKLLQFVSDMQSGRWTFNGEPLIVSRDGLINDGQHRLRALADANTALPMLFVFGVERDTRLTIDQGAARSAGDYLSMEGVENASVCASIARLVITIERENYARLYREGDATNIMVRARVETDPKIAEAAHYAATVYRYTAAFATTSIIGTAFYLLSEIHPTDAKEFMDHVSIGEELKRDDPAYAVRDALLSLGKGQRGKKLEAIFRGWIKHRSGDPLRQCKILGHFPELD